MTDFQGIYPILATPFEEDGRIDYTSLDRLIEWTLEQGVDGLGLFGNASEGYALLNEERAPLLQHIVKRVDGRVPLIASSGHTGTDAAVALSKEVADLGAQALMVLPPYLLKPDGDGLMFYFDAISKAVPIPIMVQDAPLMTGVAMPAALLARMGREIAQVKLAKVEAPPTAPKITALKNAGSELTIFGGLNAQFLIEEYQRGAVGTMPNNDIPAVYVSIWRHLKAGRTEQAWSEFARALPLIRFELQPGLGVSAMKHNMVKRGILGSARVRHPTSTLNGEGLAELEVLRRMIEE
ncbi:MAG: dihydrodipicolinate synthase family protein [Bryobacterales bacterium]|nr:dihydrodipicolinate synthase family protein [Bryobacterales bacterium]